MILGAFDLLLNFWCGHRCILPRNFLDFLNIGSDNGLPGDERGDRPSTKPPVAMTAHASRPPAAQIATTPSAGHFRSAGFGFSTDECG
jgi:hypothetical protein